MRLVHVTYGHAGMGHAPEAMQGHGSGLLRETRHLEPLSWMLRGSSVSTSGATMTGALAWEPPRQKGDIGQPARFAASAAKFR
jgi:hypothetical protein